MQNKARDGRAKERKLIHKIQKHQEIPRKDIPTRWSDLPNDLLELILQNLSLSDYLRCRLVCSSWQITLTNAIATKRCPPAPQLPLLLLGDPVICSGRKIHFMSVIESKPFTKTFKLPHDDVHCVGSVDGWLILQYGIYSLNSFHVFLNPVSRASVGLPKLSISSLSDDIVDIKITTIKVVASCAPDVPRSCLVAALFNTADNRELGFCKVEDTSWTLIDNPKDMYFHDILFHDGKLYAVTLDAADYVMVFDIQDQNNIITQRIEMLDPKPARRLGFRIQIHNRSYYPTSYESVFLMEDPSSGELLLLFCVNSDSHTRLYFNVRRKFVVPSRPKGFQVFKMDKNSLRWMPVDNLGDRALFISGYGCKVISTTNLDCPQKNCIYFSLDYTCFEGSSLRRQIGAFSLTNKSFWPIRLDSSFHKSAQIHWFTPSPW